MNFVRQASMLQYGSNIPGHLNWDTGARSEKLLHVLVSWTYGNPILILCGLVMDTSGQ